MFATLIVVLFRFALLWTVASCVVVLGTCTWIACAWPHRKED